MTTKPKPMPLFGGRKRSSGEYSNEPKPQENGHTQHNMHLPGFNHNGHKITPGIKPEGESGRRGIHPIQFIKIVWLSSCTASKWVNVLWPAVPAAIALHFARPDLHLAIFILCYIAMVPAANLLGFAGQELARKLPKVFGVVIETTFGSLVEIVLFMVLLIHNRVKPVNGETTENAGVPIIQAAILGSILANLLLCLGACFFVGGIFRNEQKFHDAVSDTGSNLMLVAGMALVIPTTYYTALKDRTDIPNIERDVLHISRACAIILLIAYVFYVFFQTHSHHGLYDDIFEGDEERDRDRERDLAKPKLTLAESILAVILAITFVTLMAIFLVLEIEPIVHHHGVSDAFVGLILVPLVEKAAEHITAVDEAYDNQMNLALSHVLGASVQTALLNTPLVVIVGWGLKIDMGLDFELFHTVVLILAILVVGGFLRDGKSNYLEGALCIFVYVLIAVSAFYYPDPKPGLPASSGNVEGESVGGH